ncbi:PREDICTED: uncharacterized protein LOC105949723 [Erythranthe guttata]|uniref:uncharacterized protein LOC105949723 n=1 Tax=Erythranthe guttata TaxID=4155 RepID=UPI00064DB878|nr:PREDICTED: uncharacterized protein LOC105949723 [Erythranthe guttata]|eukprot:XP_012828496.1 PREDICTED: uncharacterized protein LOC105949723 [Erythranthe guttata]
MRQHSIVNGRDIKLRLNEKYKIQAICKHPSCPWLVNASQMRGESTFQIKTINAVHECNRKEWVAYATSRAKQKAIEKSTGSNIEQYGLIWRYAQEIKKSSPRTTVRIKGSCETDQLKFKRIYICWDALRQGFLNGCRPIIFLHVCHLKSIYGGILLCAVGIDGNNGMYPFAYPVVEKEKRESWLWFMNLLKENLKIEESQHWTIMSDKQKGLLDAVEEVLPNTARASRVVDFEGVMRDLASKDKDAFKWLAKRPVAHSTRAFFNTNSKCDALLNNMCESFNAMILRTRSLPIIDMLEAIRKTLMKRLHVKRDKMASHKGDICPNIQRQIEEWKKKSMEFIPNWNGKDQFEVANCYCDRFKVHLGDKTCSCRKWQIYGIPYAHSILGMYYLGRKPEDYVEELYNKNTYMRVYIHLLDTLEGIESWPESENPPLLPPDIVKMPGRPKLHKRRRQPGEINGPKDIPPPVAKTKNHNARSCPLKKASGAVNDKGQKKKSNTQATVTQQQSQTVTEQQSQTTFEPHMEVQTSNAINRRGFVKEGACDNTSKCERVREVPKNPVTIEFHYGENFMWKPMIKVCWRNVGVLEIEDRATLSYMYFEQLYHSQFGINERCLIYYRVAGETLDKGLKKLKEDEDVIQMVTTYEGLLGLGNTI